MAAAVFTRTRAQFWTQLAGQSDAVRLLAMYLQTNEAAAAEPYGLYQVPLEAIARGLGHTAEAVRDGLWSLQDLRWAYYDDISCWLWVVDHAAHQLLPDGLRPLLPKDNLVRAANRWWEALPANRWLEPYYEYYRERLHLRKRRSGADALPLVGGIEVGNGGGHALVLPEAPQLPTAHVQRQYEFAQLWEQYPKAGKTSRITARDAYMRLSPAPRFDDVMEGLQRWYRSRMWAQGYIVNCAKWIKEQRWEAHPEEIAEGGRTVNVARGIRGDIFS